MSNPLLQSLQHSLDALAASIRGLQDSERSLYLSSHPGRRLPGGRQLRTKRLCKKRDVGIQRFVADFWLDAARKMHRAQRLEVVSNSLLPFDVLVARYNDKLGQIRQELHDASEEYQRRIDYAMLSHGPAKQAELTQDATVDVLRNSPPRTTSSL